MQNTTLLKHERLSSIPNKEIIFNGGLRSVKRNLLRIAICLCGLLAFSNLSHAQVDLSIEKSVDEAVAEVGDTVNFMIVISNDGLETADSILVIDLLDPAVFTYESSSATINGYNNATGEWWLDSLEVGVQDTLLIEAVLVQPGVSYNMVEVDSIAATQFDVDSEPGNAALSEDDMSAACISIPLEICTAALDTVVLTTSGDLENIQWFKDGVQIFGETDTTLTVLEEGLYTYTADFNGCEADICCPILVEEGECYVDLELEKMVFQDDMVTPADTINVGDTVYWRIVVENRTMAPDTAMMPATNVDVHDQLPSCLTFVNWQANDGTYAVGSATWHIDTIHNGTSDTLWIATELNDYGTCINLAQIEMVDQDDIDSTPNNDDPDEDDQDQDTVYVPVFDLALTKLVSSAGPFAIGDQVTFTINVANQGNIDAYNVGVVDYVPAGFTYDPANNGTNFTMGAVGDAMVFDTIPTIGAGMSASVSITLTVNGSDISTQGLTNTAEITYGEDENGNTPPDEDSFPDTTNGDDLVDRTGATDHTDIDYTPDDEDDHDIASIMLDNFDLALTKVYNTYNDTNGDGVLSPGDDVTFTVTVYNQGTIDADSVEVVDYVPSDMVYDMTHASNVANNWGAGPDPTTKIYNLQAGGIATVDIVLQVSPTFTGTSIVNDAEINQAWNEFNEPDQDSTPGNDSATNSELSTDNNIDDESPSAPGGADHPSDSDDYDPAEIAVVQLSFDMALTKAYTTFTDNNGDMVLSPGDDVIFTITVYNQGNIIADSVEVIDYVPTDMVYDMTHASNVANDWGAGPNPTTRLYNIAPGGIQTVDIVLQVSPMFSGTSIVNNAEINQTWNPLNEPDEDSTPGDNSMTGSELGTDENIDDDGPGTPGVVDHPGDNDDYDPAEIMIEQLIFDLALTKVYSSYIDVDADNMISSGDSIYYTISVFNQGTLDADSLEITDYVPMDLNYDPTHLVNIANGWDNNPDPRTKVYNLAAGTTQSVVIVMEIDPGFMGTSIVNDAEITDADNAFGTPDEDSMPGDNASTGSELDTDNDIDDDGDGTPGLVDNPFDNDDFDPAEIMVGQVFDLALTKVVNTTATPGPFAPGDPVTFTIEVCNQGTLNAYDVQVSDYIPAGLTLNDLDWDDSDADGIAVLVDDIDEILVTDPCQTVDISFTIDSDFQGTSIVNEAEVSFATADDDSGINTNDVDSDPDGVNDDVVGGDGITDNSNGDEDDHDPAEIAVVQIFDLALIKTINSGTPGPYMPGSTVAFDITVTNQGTLDAYNVQVADYVPAGLVLADVNWSLTGSTATLSNEIPFIAAGDNEVVTITFSIDNSFTGNSIINDAEIYSADDDQDSTNTPPTDADSTPGDNSATPSETGTPDNVIVDANDGSAQDDDPEHDDFDPAEIMVEQIFDLALTKMYSGFIDNDGDNMISPGDDIDFTITVYNQGTIEAENIVVTDYVATGMNFILADNTVFSDAIPATPTTPQATITSLAGGASANLVIRLEIDAAFQGTSLINNAEITSAENDLGIADQDSPIDPAGVNGLDGNADDDSELDTDNDIDDEADGTPGIADNGSDIDDYDPAEVMVGQVFDLALIKTINTTATPGPYAPGGMVTFTLEVFNQGTLDAFDVQLSDYIPAGLTLADADWEDGDNDGIANLVTPIATVPASSTSDPSVTVDITFTIDADFQGTSITNEAEISFATSDDDSGINTPDVDSDPDSVNDDNQGPDDEINNAGGDEDDHDPATIPVDQIFDLALIKTINSGTPGPYAPGSTVSFDITVTNQGTLDAYNVAVSDYVPMGLTLADVNWMMSGTTATISNEIPFIGAGLSEVVTITFVIDSNFEGTSIVNNAEITAADDDTNPANTPPTDADSNPGDNSSTPSETGTSDDVIVDADDGSAQDDDPEHDDYDPAEIGVVQEFDLALTKTYSSFNDNDGDSMISPGDDILYQITVYNQGTITGTTITVTDYVPTGMNFNTSDNTDFTGAAPMPTASVSSIAPGMSLTLSLVLEIDNAFQGSSLINNAEITAASNALGLPDEDSPIDPAGIANLDGSSNDDSEMDTDNDINDEAAGTPGTADNGSDIDDYDPAEVMVGQVFDLALIKTINTTATPGPYAPGGMVTFTLEVFNQGTLDAYDVQLSDYIPAGLTLADADWEDGDNDGIANLVTPIATVPASSTSDPSVTVDITFTIDANFQGTSITNEGEISFATSDDDSGINTPDIDSDPDSVNDDNQGPDDEINNAGGDEDDHDPAEITVEQIFDLALEKTFANSSDTPIMPGSTVTFTIEVTNQGTVDAYNIELDDYIPTGLILADAGWSENTVGIASLNNDIPFIAPGEQASVNITFTVDPLYTGTSIINYAEISAADDNDDPADGMPMDADSNPGDNQGDDETANDGEITDTDDGSLQDDDADSDDYDPAEIAVEHVFDLALTKVYSEYTDRDGDNQISGDDYVTFIITVYNQGTLAATNVEITDYTRPGLLWLPGSTINTGAPWVFGTDAVHTVGALAAGDSYSVRVRYRVDPTFMGTSIVNDAEISAATNDLGQPDQDSSPGNNSGTPSELDSDNDIDDEADGTPGSTDNPFDFDDYDPAEIMIGQTFDLALTKVVSSPGPFSPGSSVTFTLEVFNQGTLDAYDVQLSDYIPAGLTLADADWEDGDNDGIANLVTPLAFIPASTTSDPSTTVDITFTIDADFQGTSIINEAEISFATSDDDSGINTPDIDSDPDSVNDDNQGPDNEINNAGGDEDDHDPAEITVDQIFDLALEKTFANSSDNPIIPGSTVTFTIEVTNQGTLDAYNIELDDYIPVGLILADADWSENTIGIASLNNDIPFIAAGEQASVNITFMVDPSFMGANIINYAEISAADDNDNPADGMPMDADSNPGDNQGDDETANDGEITDTDDGSLQDDDADSDDYDPAEISVAQEFDLALTKMYTSFNDNDGDNMISPGDDVIYGITVFNQGTLEGTAITVTDYVPTGMNFNSGDNTDFTGAAPMPTASIASLAAGASTTLSLVLEIDASFQGVNLINNAEITAATNALGLPDEDSPIDPAGVTNLDGASDDDSEMDTDNDIDDEADGTPGIADNGADIDDYDPAEITVGQTFDLALTKVLNTTATPGPFSPGSMVTFTLEVYNQGTLDAYDIQLSDYIPAGLTLADADWEDNDNDGIANLVTPIGSVPASATTDPSVTIDITFMVDANFMGTSITNEAEISFATADDDSGINTPDIDSDPDSVNDDNQGPDNEINNVGGDEDDHDPAEITIEQVFDLALEKTFNASSDSPIVQGSMVTFTIDVHNQGTLDAYNIELDDYIPTGLILMDPFWQETTPGVASLINDIPFIGVGEVESVNITFQVDPTFQGLQIINYAEISAADDNDDPTDGMPMDADSNPGDNQGDDETANDGEITDTDDGSLQDDDADSDDYDPEAIDIHQEFDLALDKTYSTFIDNDGDGVITPGDDVVFDITVYNQGSLDASNVVLTDFVPTGMNFDPADNIDFAGTPPVHMIASLPQGASMTRTIILEVDPAFMGSSLVNNAEITAATNIHGFADEDSPIDPAGIADIDGSPDDDSELDTDNDVDDEYDGTPGTEDNVDDIDDWDPEEITVGQEFDLSLTKLEVPSGPYTIGDKVDFQINLHNQGTLDAANITVEDRVPSGFTFDPADNTDFTGIYGASVVTANVADLDVGVSATLTITLTINSTAGTAADDLVNTSEISRAEDDFGNQPMDVDSYPDSDDNDLVDDRTGPTDHIDIDDTNDDEDDHDIAAIELGEFDLSLTKLVAKNTHVTPGQPVMFMINVHNQGEIDAEFVTIEDHVPSGFIFDPTLNTDFTGTYGATPVTAIIPDLDAGMSANLTITLIASGTAGTVPGDLTNTAEISYAQNDNGEVHPDEDSTPDQNPDNDDLIDRDGSTAHIDIDVSNGDEDDHDIAGVSLATFDLALTKLLTSAGPFTAGAAVTFDINVANQGDVDAQDVTVVDYIPSGLHFDPALNSDFVGALGDAAPIAIIPDLNAGMSATLTITLTITGTGTSTADMTNAAEITSAENDYGQMPTDEDSFPDSTNGDMTVDRTGPTDHEDIDYTPDDEDDHDIAVVPMDAFDLALRKQLANSQSPTVAPGQDVTFMITVQNQGSVYADSIEITDYIPSNMTLSDANWDGSNPGVATRVLTVGNGELPSGGLAPGTAVTTMIVLKVSNTAPANSTITNWAEISSAQDTFGNEQDDIDSDADGINDDIFLFDNDTSGDGKAGGDEDDHDKAEVMVVEFDLALIKMVSANETGPFTIGDTVTFDIRVINQGMVAADEIMVIDYIPAGFILADPDWAGASNGPATTTLNVVDGLPAGGLAPGNSVVVKIDLEVDVTVNDGDVLVNKAEIASATDTDGNVIPDVDSNPDRLDDDILLFDNDTSGNGKAGGDEDDHDKAEIEIEVIEYVDLELDKKVRDDAGADIEGATISIGDIITYEVMVMNNPSGAPGMFDATGVEVFDLLPTGLEYVSYNATQGTYSPATGAWTVGNLDNGDAASIFITAELTATGVIENVAQVSAADQPDIDSVPNNDDGDQSEDEEDSVVITSACPSGQIASISSDVEICKGECAQLSVGKSKKDIIMWSPATGLDNPSIANPVACPDVTTTYTVTVVSPDGCSTSADVTVTVNCPELVQEIGDIEICGGGSQMVCTELNENINSYTISSNNSSYSNASVNGAILCFEAALNGSSSTFTVELVGESGCSVSQDFVVKEAFSVSADFVVDAVICAGSGETAEVRFTGSASNSAVLNWDMADGTIVSSSPATASAPAAAVIEVRWSTPGNRFVSLSVNDGGCSGESTQAIFVNAMPVVDLGPDAFVCKGECITIGIPNEDKRTYDWSSNAGATGNASYVEVCPRETSTYSLTVSDPQGCEMTDEISVSVACPEANAGPDRSICAGRSATLTGSGGLIYAWSPATGLSCTDCASPTASPSSTTTYTLTITDQYGCQDTDQVTVTVNPNPVANAGDDQIICGRGSAALNASGGVSYAWSPAAGLSCTNCDSPTASPLVTTMYTVTVTNAQGCTDTDQVAVLVADDISVTANSSDAACGQSNGSIQLSVSGGVGTLTYQWSPNVSNGASANNLAPGEYCYTITDQTTGCTASGCETIEDGGAIQAIASVREGDCCNGGSVNISVNGGSGPYTYVWTPAVSNSNQASNLDEGTYTVVVTDRNGCTDRLDIIVEVDCDCSDLDCFDDEPLCADDLTWPYSVCLCFGPNEEDQYQVTVNGQILTEFESCRGTSLIDYFRNCMETAGYDGPYEVNSWTINGQVFNAPLLTDMNALLAWMQNTDPSGGWSFYGNSNSIRGSSSTNNYGSLVVTNINGGKECNVPPAISTEILEYEVLMLTPGDYCVEITDLNTCCTEKLIIEDDCGVVDPPCIPDYITVTTDMNTPINVCATADDLPGSAVSISMCMPDNGTFTNVATPCVDYVPSTGFTGIDNFCIVACDAQGHCDSTYVTVNVIDNTTSPCEDFITLEEKFFHYVNCDNIRASICIDDLEFAEVDQYNIYLNGSTYDGDIYGCFRGEYVNIMVENEGEHEVVIERISTGCTDTVAVTISCGIRVEDDVEEIDPIMGLTMENTDTSTTSGKAVIIDPILDQSVLNAYDLTIIAQPDNGRSVITPTGEIEFIPHDGFCDDAQSEIIIYEICSGDECDQGQINVRVVCKAPLVFFNGISPNNDGVNDTFIIEGIEEYPDNRVQIFTRNGNRVFSQYGYDNSWNGQKDGKDLPQGTYFYILDDGEGNKHSGYLQLNR